MYLIRKKLMFTDFNKTFLVSYNYSKNSVTFSMDIHINRSENKNQNVRQ